MRLFLGCLNTPEGDSLTKSTEDNMKKTISVLGATGSVGRQALDVARERGYKVDFLCAGSDAVGMEGYAREFNPKTVAMANEDAARELSVKLRDTDIKVLSGVEGVLSGIADSKCDVAVNSILGEAGLAPSLAVIESGKRLALANKESLVIAGDIVMNAAKEKGQLRSEGKEYVMQDGDMVYFRFNV